MSRYPQGTGNIYASCKGCIGNVGSALPDLLYFKEKLKMCVCMGLGTGVATFKT